MALSPAPISAACVNEYPYKFGTAWSNWFSRIRFTGIGGNVVTDDSSSIYNPSLYNPYIPIDSDLANPALESGLNIQSQSTASTSDAYVTIRWVYGGTQNYGPWPNHPAYSRLTFVSGFNPPYNRHPEIRYTGDLQFVNRNMLTIQADATSATTWFSPGGGSQFLVSIDSDSTFTNKTYDTAGAGNIFKINGTQITAKTGTGSVVLADTPTLITPILGTPQSGNLINGTGYTEANLSVSDIATNNSSISAHGFLKKLDNDPTHFMNGQGNWTVAGSGDALTTNPLSQFAATTSAQLAGVLSDETGTGAAVFGTSPTLTTPVINGITDGSNAAAGVVGEVVTSTLSTGSAISLTSDIGSNVTSISLTAGDWEVSGQIGIMPALTTTIRYLIGGATTASGAVAANTYTQIVFPSGTVLGAIDYINTIPTQRINITTTTTVYLVVQSQFGVSTLKGYGRISARRVR